MLHFTRSLGGATAAILLTSLCWTTSAGAQAPNDLRDLVGSRAAGGETQLEARGYRFLRVTTSRDQKWGLWWSPMRRQCIQVSTYEGRFETINLVPGYNCGDDDDDARPSDRVGRGSLTLICYGEGRKPTTRARAGYQWDDRRDRFEPTTRIESGTKRFESEVQVEIRGDRGRIHLTGKLVPPVNSGGVRGWWPLDDLRINSERISGRYRMNGMNSPRVEINRRSGRIAINGIEKFRGECDVGDWSDSGRKF